MGDWYRTTEDGKHIATGKNLAVEPGTVHEPQWGAWEPDTYGWLRHCWWAPPGGGVIEGCDIDDYSKEKPS